MKLLALVLLVYAGTIIAIIAVNAQQTCTTQCSPDGVGGSYCTTTCW